MTDETTTTTDEPIRAGETDPNDVLGPALVVVYSRTPETVGDTYLVPEGESIIGRGEPREDDPAPRLVAVRQRPGSNEPRPPLDDRYVSRVQLKVSRKGDTIRVENVGRGSLVEANGKSASVLQLDPGDAFALGDHLGFLCVERPRRMRRLRDLETSAIPEFGEPDANGAVGESVPAWTARDAIAFLGGRSAHVLLLGPSGSGKEIAAQSIHRSSIRRARPLVARNAATIPTTLVEAELFGHAANYPSSGMPERVGLVGEAAGSTLFLDEIGELPDELQTRLLRLLDSSGEYQRLGDPKRRVSDLRFIGATHRNVDVLRNDLAARLKLRLRLVGLDERRDDVPFLARHLLKNIAAKDQVVAKRFFDSGTGEPRMSCRLMMRLVSHSYTTNVRELESLLWISISQSNGDVLDVTADLEQDEAAVSSKPVAHDAVTADMIRAALERCNGSREQAWRELGLANRHVLKRLMKKYSL